MLVVLLCITNLEREVFCSLRNDLSDNFNFMSIFIAIGVPLVFGPMFCPIGHTLLSLIACCKGVSTSTCTLKDPKSQGMLSFFYTCKVQLQRIKFKPSRHKKFYIYAWSMWCIKNFGNRLYSGSPLLL